MAREQCRGRATAHTRGRAATDALATSVLFSIFLCVLACRAPTRRSAAAAWVSEAQGAPKAAATLPPIALRDLLAPRQPLSDGGLDALGRVTAGVKEPLKRLLSTLAARSFLPLIPILAAVEAWREHLAQFPTAAQLGEELRDVLQDTTNELRKRQVRLAPPRSFDCLCFALWPVLLLVGTWPTHATWLRCSRGLLAPARRSHSVTHQPLAGVGDLACLKPHLTSVRAFQPLKGDEARLR